MRVAKTALGGLVMVVVLVMAGTSLQAQMPPGPGPNAVRGFGPGMDIRFSAKVVKGAPFSAQALTEVDETLSDGNQIHRTATSTLYRDSQGRTRREETVGAIGPWEPPQGNGQPMVLINDPVAGTNYVLNPTTHTAHRMAQFHNRMERRSQSTDNATGAPVAAPEGHGPRDFEERVAEEGGTVNKEPLGTQMVQGVQAEGTRTTVTFPAGSMGNTKPIQIVTEQWYSPALQMVVMSTRHDPRFGQTTYRLTNINQVEPAAELFQVPSEYTVQDMPRQMRQSTPPPQQ